MSSHEKLCNQRSYTNKDQEKHSEQNKASFILTTKLSQKFCANLNVLSFIHLLNHFYADHCE